MFASPREYAEELLNTNLGKTHEETINAALRAAFDNARLFPNVSTQFWADVVGQIEFLAQQAIDDAEAEFYQGCDDGQGPRYGYDTTGGECEWGID